MKLKTHFSPSQAQFWSRFLAFVGLFIMLTAFIPGQAAALDTPAQPYYIRYESGQRESVITRIKSLGGSINYDLSRWNLLAVSLPEQNRNRLDSITGIMSSEPVPQYELAGEEYPFGLDLVQALDVWDFNRDGVLDPGAPTGSGIKVCIIDTGVFDGHKDLSATTIDGFSQIEGEAWNETNNGHGTHVAGTVAANVQGIGLSGVAPGVELFIVKVFNLSGNWVDAQSNIGAAAATCADNGANIINLSLKGDQSAEEELIFDSLYNDDGILIVASAGNDGNSSGTDDKLAYPASYDSVVSVGALTSSKTHAYYSNENSQVEFAAPGSAVVSTWPKPENGSIPFGKVTDDWNEHSGVYMEASTPGTQTGLLIDGGLCREEDMTHDWNGKIVLCQRQDLLFRDMVGHTETKGALATIIIWKYAGLMIGTLAPGTSSGPVVMVSKETGEYLKDQKIGTSVTVETNDGSDSLPGPGGYRGMNGTSMASPHVAGVAALVWSVCPDLTNGDLRTLLEKTALDLGENGRDHSFGFGLVQAFDAWHHCQPADLSDSARSYGLARHTDNGSLRLGIFWGTNSWQGTYPGQGFDDRDDDGLVFTELKAGEEATVFISAKGAAQNPWVTGWLDFNRDGTFTSDEMVVNDPIELNHVTALNFNVPASVDTKVAVNYRFRIYDNQAQPQKNAPAALTATIVGGEVEDGLTSPIPTAVTLFTFSPAQFINVKESGFLIFISLTLLTAGVLKRNISAKRGF